MRPSPLAHLFAVLYLPALTASAGLVGYWPLDGDFADASGNGNHGTLFGGASYGADVPATLGTGMSVEFDGAAGTYGSINDGAGGLSLTTSAEFTVSMWVKGNAGPGSGRADDRVFSEGMTTDEIPLFNVGTHVSATNGAVDIYIRNGGAAETFEHAHSTDTTVFDDSGTWRHLLFSGGTDGMLDLYIDGVFDRTFDYSNVPAFTPDTTTIGGILRATDCCNFQGKIDELAMWDETLNNLSIAALAAGESPLSIPREPSPSGALCAYWPMDSTNGLTTPDLGPNSYDLTLNFMDAGNFVAGRFGNAATFDGVEEMLTRTHGPDDELPITDHALYTISAWVNITGTGQVDRRFFSEASTTDDVPLFNLGTHNTGADGRIDSYIRPSGGPAHEYSTGAPLDGTWRHIAVTGDSVTGVLAVYIDGVLDSDTITFRDLRGLGLDTTSIGGILRADPTHWLNGLVDDVSLWKTLLTPEEIAELAAGTNPLDLAGGGEPFAITEVAFDGTDVSLTWNSVPNRFYAVFASKDLADGSWENFELDDGFLSTGDISTFVWPGDNLTPVVDPASEDALFFRVEDRGPGP